MRVRGYAICTTPRSGSNYLCALLASTGGLGTPLEYFNSEGRRALESPDYPSEPVEQIERILTDGRTPNGVYGLKIFPNQLERTLVHLSVFDRLPELSFFRLLRRDVLGQAISWARALQTGQYRHSQQMLSAPRYDGDLIAARLAEIACANADWDIYFGRRGICPTVVYYEDLEVDAQSSIASIALQMGVEGARTDPERINVVTQRDDINENWRLRFIAERGDANLIQRSTPPVMTST